MKPKKFWCVNFDAELVLQHGLADAMWLMQYQYSHGGYHFQGHRAQLSATSTNWNLLTRVAVGDWLAAYLRSSTFYAVGQVIEPRVWQRHAGAARHTDTVERTVQEHRHRFLDGVVRYGDAPAAYEDFTDPWTSPNDPAIKHQPVVWQVPATNRCS